MKFIVGKIILPLATFFSILLLAFPVVFAQNPSLSVSKDLVTIFNGEEDFIELTIQNNLNRRETYSVAVFPSFWNHVSSFPSPRIIELESGESGIVKIHVSSLPEAQLGTQSIGLNIGAASDNEVNSNKTILVRVNRRSPVFVLEVNTDKSAVEPEDTITINSVVSNIGNIKSESYALRTIVSFNGEEVERFDKFITSVAKKSDEIISNQMTFPKDAEPGTYDITSMLFNEFGFTVSSVKGSFELLGVYDIPEDYTNRITTLGILSIGVELTVKNSGNIETPAFYITENIPVFARDFFIPENLPSTTEQEGGTITYSWLVNSLEPGEETTIKYQFIIWQVWVILIMVGAIVYFAFNYVFTVSLVKSHRNIGLIRKENEIPVNVELRNRSRHELRDIVIRDFVPGVAEVVTKFTHLKPTIRKGRNGTELTWKFDSVRAGEDRVMTYKIRPILDVLGTLKLPRAGAKYVTKRKHTKTMKSKHVTVS